MNPFQIPNRSLARTLLVLCSVLLILAGCGGGGTPTPVVPPPPTATPTPIPPTRTPQPSPTPNDFFVSILNRRLTRPEIVDTIRGEGTVMVGGFNYTASDALKKQFEAWIQKEYGVDITLQYSTEASPGTYLEQVFAAQQGNTPMPYDVIAVEENYLVDALAKNAVAEMLPSDLLSNAAEVVIKPDHSPYAVPFQATATVAPIFHNDSVGAWFHDWRDLADARLRRRIVLPRAEGKVAGLFLIGLAGSLGMDYKNPAQMRETIEFVCTEIQPNVLRYTNNFSEIQELLRENQVDAAVTWNLLARLERYSGADGTGDIVFMPMTSGQPAINGYAWIPQGAAHPVLAQLFIQWRLSDAAQLPGAAWNISNVAWGEYHEGVLQTTNGIEIPDAVRGPYEAVYPSPDEIKQYYRAVDWTYYATHEAEWLEQYGKCVN